MIKYEVDYNGPLFEYQSKVVSGATSSTSVFANTLLTIEAIIILKYYCSKINFQE